MSSVKESTEELAESQLSDAELDEEWARQLEMAKCRDKMVVALNGHGLCPLKRIKVIELMYYQGYTVEAALEAVNWLE